VRRSGLVAFGGEADVRTRTRNDAVDPKRRFAATNYCTAKSLFDYLVGGGEHRWHNDAPINHHHF